MNKIYIYPTRTTTKGDLAFEYKVEERKEDMRTRFCKIHKNDTITAQDLLRVATANGVIVKENRIIIEGAENARAVKYIVRGNR